MLLFLLAVFKLRCRYVTFNTKLRTCEENKYGTYACLKKLQKKGLIGLEHRFSRFGQNYGMSVILKRKGVVYKHKCK